MVGGEVDPQDYCVSPNPLLGLFGLGHGQTGLGYGIGSGEIAVNLDIF